jgi:hypothetical protein
VHMHRFLSMAANAECLVILFPVVEFSRVYMMSIEVFVVRGITEIHSALLVFASPTIFCSVARTGFPKATVIVVDWCSIVSVQRQGDN